MEVKGTAIKIMPEFIENNFVEENFHKWLSSLSEEARNVYDSTIMVSDWFPLKKIYTEPTEEMCDIFYKCKTNSSIL